MLSNNSSGTSSTSACKRTIVTYDGELVESSGDEEYGANTYQRSVMLHGESASNDYAYCLADYSNYNNSMYRYDVSAHTFTRIGATSANSTAYSGRANCYIQLKGKIYWFGLYSISGVKQIQVDLIDPNTAVATRMATLDVFNDPYVYSGSYLPSVGTDGKDYIYLLTPANTSYCESQLWRYNINTGELILYTRYLEERNVTDFGELGVLHIKDDMIYYIPNNLSNYRTYGSIKYSKLGANQWNLVSNFTHNSRTAMKVTCFRDGVLMHEPGNYNPIILTLNY